MKRTAILISTLFLMATSSVGASTALMRGSSAIFNNPGTTRALSLFLGIPQPHLSGLSSLHRRSLFEGRLNSLREQKGTEWATNVNNLFLQISQGSSRAERELKSLLNNLPHREYTAQSLMSKGSQESALEALQARASGGELAPSMVEQFSQAVQSAKQSFGFDILGEGVANYFRKSSIASVGAFTLFVASLGSTNAVAGTDAAFETMVSQSEKVFNEDAVSAKARVCGFVEKGLISSAACGMSLCSACGGMCPMCGMKTNRTDSI